MNQGQPEAAVAANSDREISITRIIDAPRELVFRAWTEVELLEQWHAPQGCSIEIDSLDVREGGELRTCIQVPDGTSCWCRGTYLEVVPPERLVYTSVLTDPHGNPLDAASAGKAPEWPTETRVTVTFEDLDGKTRLHLHQNVSEALARRTGAYPSWIDMLDQLAKKLTE